MPAACLWPRVAPANAETKATLTGAPRGCLTLLLVHDASSINITDCAHGAEFVCSPAMPMTSTVNRKRVTGHRVGGSVIPEESERSYSELNLSTTPLHYPFLFFPFPLSLFPFPCLPITAREVVERPGRTDGGRTTCNQITYCRTSVVVHGFSDGIYEAHEGRSFR